MAASTPTPRWWAVLAPTLRTGAEKLVYIEANSAQIAAEILPGGSIVGGPYATEQAAQQANPGTTVQQVTNPPPGVAPQSGEAATAPASGVPPGTINATPSTLPDWLNFNVSKILVRFGEGAVGIALLAIGGIALFGQTKAGKATGKAFNSVATKGLV